MFSVAMSQIDQNINIKLFFERESQTCLCFYQKRYVELTSKVDETYRALKFRKKYNYVSDLYVLIRILNRSVPDLLFTLLWYIPDYFSYHEKSGVIFAPRHVPDYSGVM